MRRRSLYGAVLLLGIGLLGRDEGTCGQLGGPPAPPAPPSSAPETPAAALSVELRAPATLTPGQALTYEIVVRNLGSTLVTTVGVEQLVPMGSQLRLTEPRAQVQNDRMRWNLGNLEAAGERRIRVELLSPANADLPPPTVSFAPAAAHRTRSVRPPFDVTVSGPDTVQRGDKLKFQIEVANNGTAPIQHVLVRDKLPEGLQCSQGSFVEAEIGTLGPGESKTLALEVTAVRAGRWINEVSARADGDWKAESRLHVTVSEPTPGLGVEAPSPLGIEVAAHKDLLGTHDETTYEIHAVNRGSTAARQVRLTVQLPDGLALVHATGPAPMRQSPQEVAFDPLPQLRPRADAVYRVRLRGQHPGDWRFRIELSNEGTTRQLIEEVGVRVTDVPGPPRRPS